MTSVLLLSPRFPWPPFTGDRLRATIWLSALERVADVTLIAPDGDIPNGAPRFRFHPAAPSRARGAAGALRVLRGAPAHALLAASYDWTGAIASARRDAGTFDATIVLLLRLDPWVRDFLPDGFRVLDAIDSMRRSMSERAAEGSPLTRWLWRAEARRVAHAEEELARVYDRVVVVSDEEAAELGAIAIPNGMAIAPLADGPRAFDFAFWGRLAYFANADATHWLLDAIWPAIRALRPAATLLIGGADAPARIRAAHGRDGITVQSPVGSIAALARSVKVALFPVRYGTGQSSKVLEAAEGGCAIVATSRALRGFPQLAANASIADETDALARAAVAAVADESQRAMNARALRRIVETSYAREETLARLAALVQRREAAA
jgi:glycosyltransferase involved in cell wall biosynthesis